MNQIKLRKESAAFILLESIVQKALVAHIEKEQAWEIQKVHFEDEWTPDSLVEEVAETFGLQVDSVSAEFLDEDTEDEEDVECHPELTP